METPNTTEQPTDAKRKPRAKKPPKAKTPRGPRPPKEPYVIQQERDVDSISGQKDWADITPPEGAPPFSTEQDVKAYLRKQAIAGTYRAARYSKPIKVNVAQAPKVTFG